MISGLGRRATVKPAAWLVRTHCGPTRSGLRGPRFLGRPYPKAPSLGQPSSPNRGGGGQDASWLAEPARWHACARRRRGKTGPGPATALGSLWRCRIGRPSRTGAPSRTGRRGGHRSRRWSSRPPPKRRASHALNAMDKATGSGSLICAVQRRCWYPASVVNVLTPGNARGVSESERRPVLPWWSSLAISGRRAALSSMGR
jgi:hypothetical protein